MQTPIAQALALVVFGNKFLANRNIADFWPKATVFGFCERVRFFSGAEVLAAENPTAWFANLARKRVSGLQLRYGARGRGDKSTVGFVGGGGHWLIEEIEAAEKCFFWEGFWSVHDQHAPNRKIWQVSYQRVGEGVPTTPQRVPTISSIRDRLEKILDEIAAFARDARADYFAKSFERGLEALASDEPLKSCFHSEFDTDGDLSLPAKQVLAAVFHGWVFGGMGSWNDGEIGDDPVRYGALSNELYVALTEGTLAVANSTCASLRPR
jgi:hypothetical protein